MESDPRPSPLYMVKQVEQVTRSLLDDLLRPAGVTTVQYTALSVLARTDGLTSADLARRSFVRAQSAADLVSVLTRRGLITRQPDPANRRRLLISLTADGRNLLAEYGPPVDELEERMLEGFTGGEREDFRDFLLRAQRTLVDEVERRSQPGGPTD